MKKNWLQAWLSVRFGEADILNNLPHLFNRRRPVLNLGISAGKVDALSLSHSSSQVPFLVKEPIQQTCDNSSSSCSARLVCSCFDKSKKGKKKVATLINGLRK